ncbi:XRE family transcriptional regulator [Oceanotoga sp. DSM 15011]|uniref:helix-turn-helix domain-containing protein n=1 Tax=Oceanotoga sp. DSM 15011 TaxID=2984951 RepID=UPI0021F3E624|nr:XRE family transcriptional regulator [Oceanotoga sp. DSM 15011]UYP01192.1 XRE family transcriptional regulator [Oceanotoga sp. DSM 15011]
MIDDIGNKVKKLRSKKNMTLKELSEKTDLSTGFLSQFERGLTTIAIDSLEKISKVLDVKLSYFFQEDISKDEDDVVIRSYEKEVYQVDSSFIIHYHLTKNVKDKCMLTRYIELLPKKKNENIKTYSHVGEEFLYVLEGIVTLFVGDKEYDLFPGDSAHYSSNIPHNWTNNTNKKVSFIFVNTPNGHKFCE